MSLFQNSVAQKYLNRLDANLLETKYNEFTACFGNPGIQENIRNSKEEQFQEGFLRELFVKILGFTLNPSANFNLTTEYKNVKDSKKADGAIVIDNLVKAVIELKGTSISDLGKVEAQAFGYKNNQPDCDYVITSNFEKLRFYIDNAIEFEEFNLFTLTRPDFGMLYLCLSYDAIANGIPKAIKTESLGQEDVITKKLYQDYSLFKRELYQNLVQQNPQYDQLTIFKESQKLLDRFLFLFFAEDRQLLPPNSVRLVLNDWRDLQERDEHVPLYNRFKKYFGYLNTGFKGKRYDVYAYNGGLFRPDDILDNLTIEDELLYKHTLALSEYDFASEVDVNILGRIFENSLNEIDEIKARIEGHDVDKTKTRRKKEGIFYTPKYITKYIVENTVGKLCTEKKAEFQINEEDYTTDRKRNTRTRESFADKLKAYRNWLLQLTICDPACGSGAFLNQALDFLITEHRYIDELQSRLFGDSLVLSDIEKSILENNLFGVDLNEESVEIAKLSLWLRTAQPNRKLNDLNNNIKCGNSLIDDPAVAGDRAFNWQKEFPKIFRVKDKKAWHITCATHNSRYSQRMFNNYVKVGEPVWLTAKEEIIVSETIAEISTNDKLNIPAYNICGDHMHLILVCEESELPSIVQKIKSMSARACNIAMGRTTTREHRTREHAPLSSRECAPSREYAPAKEHTPASPRGETQAHLWTQKFGQNEITSETQLHNTIRYVRNNRIKHGLPELGTEGTGSLYENTPIDKGACSLVFSPIDASIHTGACSSVVDRICCSIDHAFRTEYTGGFDVVIGNPPYGADLDASSKEFYQKRWKTFQGNFEIYFFFIEFISSVLKPKGKIGFITPDTWIKIPQAKKLREHVLDNYGINNIVVFKHSVFADASVNTIVFILTFKDLCSQCEVINFDTKASITGFSSDNIKVLQIENWKKSVDKQFQVSQNIIEIEIIEKIISISRLGEEFLDVCQGIVPYSTENLTKEEVENRIYHSKVKENEHFGIWIQGRAINRYSINAHSDEYLHYGSWLHRARKHKYFVNERILIQEITGGNPPRISAVSFNSIIYHDPGIISCLNISNLDTKYLLALINSNLISWFNIMTSPKGNRVTFPKVLIGDIRKFPFVDIGKEKQQPFISKADQMLSLNKELQETSQKFQRTIQRKFTLGDLSNKLRDWYLLSYAAFITELTKKKVKLSLSEEAEWEAYFIQETEKALELKARINATDKEIDQMVYQLYGLTDEEIKIVEGKPQLQRS